MKIINTFNNKDGCIAYVEFTDGGKKKILSIKHFEERYGNILIK